MHTALSLVLMTSLAYGGPLPPPPIGEQQPTEETETAEEPTAADADSESTTPAEAEPGAEVTSTAETEPAEAPPPTADETDLVAQHNLKHEVRESQATTGPSNRDRRHAGSLNRRERKLRNAAIGSGVVFGLFAVMTVGFVIAGRAGELACANANDPSGCNPKRRPQMDIGAAATGLVAAASGHTLLVTSFMLAHERSSQARLGFGPGGVQVRF